MIHHSKWHPKSWSQQLRAQVHVAPAECASNAPWFSRRPVPSGTRIQADPRDQVFKRNIQQPQFNNVNIGRNWQVGRLALLFFILLAIVEFWSGDCCDLVVCVYHLTSTCGIQYHWTSSPSPKWAMNTSQMAEVAWHLPNISFKLLKKRGTRGVSPILSPSTIWNTHLEMLVHWYIDFSTWTQNISTRCWFHSS